jgi:hypothetical protein
MARRLMRRIFIQVISLALLISAFPNATRHNYFAWSQGRNDEFFYFSDGLKIPLTLSTEHVAVRFLQGDKIPTFSMSYPEIADLALQKADLPQGLSLLKLTSGIDGNSVKSLLSRLGSESKISLVAPVFAAPGADMIVTDEFIVRFAPSMGESIIEELNRIHAVEVVEKVNWLENTYILRVVHGHALETANTYNNMKEVVFAHPNFIRILKDPARQKPNADLKANQGQDSQLRAWNMQMGKGAGDNSVITPAAPSLPYSFSQGPSGPLQGSVTRVMIKAEDFEGPFPNTWQLFGTPTWGASSNRKYQGSFAGYCIGSIYPPRFHYPASMDAWMLYGPFSLADALDARVDLQA